MLLIAGYLEQAQLSMAAYALNLTPGISGQPYTDKLEQAGMSSSQASVFASNYSVLDQYEDPTTGFSATIFRDTTGKTHFAIRGSEGFFTSTGAVDWLNANFQDIGRDGIAIDQGLALLNYLQRLYAPVGSSVTQYVYFPITGTISEFTDTANGALNTQTAQLEVTGHSLGGHLAMIMSRLVPNLVSSVHTFNAPGFDTTAGPQNNPPLTSEGFFNLLQNVTTPPITDVIGSSWTPAVMTHLDVSSDFVHQLGNTPGGSQNIFSETAQQLKARHDIDAMTDSLAVYNLLSTFNPSLTLDELFSIYTGFINGEIRLSPTTYPGGLLHFIDDETGYNTRKFENVPQDTELTIEFGKETSGDALAGTAGKDHLYGRDTGNVVYMIKAA